MKKLLSLLFVIAVVLTSCEGDQGPMGPPGYDGVDGTNGKDGFIDAFAAFQKEVDFNADNNFSDQENYGFEVEISDVALVYILWDNIDGVDIWRSLPQTVAFEDGDLIYNFDFTQTDVRFFLDGTTDFTKLEAQWTQKQVFRVVVVPADNVDSIDVSDINKIMQATNIKSFELK